MTVTGALAQMNDGLQVSGINGLTVLSGLSNIFSVGAGNTDTTVNNNLDVGGTIYNSNMQSLVGSLV